MNFANRFDVSADGQRLLMLRLDTTGTERKETTPHLAMVLNWFEELKRLVPTGQ